MDASSDALAEAPNLTPPPGNPRFPLFDSLRAIAALSVFAAHSLTITAASQHYRLGQYADELASQGVATFFLISGFLLYRPFVAARFAGRPFRIGDYARRRFLRIVPAYWVALTVIVLYVSRNGVTLGNAWIFYGFGQLYQTDTIGDGIGAAWTLGVEVTFYVSLPLFALAAARLGRGRRSVRGDLMLIVPAAVVSLVLHGLFHRVPHSLIWLELTLPATFYWFALGMALAVLSVRDRAHGSPSRLNRLVTRWPTACWLLAIALFALLCGALDHPKRIGTGSLPEFALYGLVGLCILLPGVFGDEAGGLARRVLRIRFLGWIGLVSYAFYLYHTNVIAYVSEHGMGHDLSHPYLYTLVLAFPATCMVAAASYYLLERPILQMKNAPLRDVIARFRSRATVPRARGVTLAGNKPSRR